MDIKNEQFTIEQINNAVGIKHNGMGLIFNAPTKNNLLYSWTLTKKLPSDSKSWMRLEDIGYTVYWTNNTIMLMIRKDGWELISK